MSFKGFGEKSMEFLKLPSKKSKNLIGFYQKLIEIIRRGGVVIFPTDTIYGLLADATNKKAVNEVFRMKRRISQKYLPLFVKDLKAIKNVAKINKKQEKFLRKIWPGKVTVVLKRKKKVKLYGIAKETIALRIPNFQPLNQLLQLTDIPLTATSANISGEIISNNLKEILRQFVKQKNKPDIIVDAGKLSNRKPSIIIDLTKEVPRLLRI